MKKTRNILLTALFIGAFALPSLFLFTGCSTVSDWAEDNPTQANLAKAGLLTGLNFFLENNPDYSVHEASLRGAIQFALAEAATAEEAAALLDSQTLEVLDDPDVRAALLAAWQAELDKRTTTPEGVPASGPAVDYARDLSNALGNSPVASVRKADENAYQLGTIYPAPAYAESRWGDHWSDPLWSVTSFASGCDSYASFRAWHAVPTTAAIEAQWNDRHAQLARLN